MAKLDIKPSIRENTKDIRHCIAKDFINKAGVIVPKGLRIVNLFDNRFRLYVKGENNVIDSFFIHASPNGEITYCNPEIRSN
jgi:hypothetical protein